MRALSFWYCAPLTVIFLLTSVVVSDVILEATFCRASRFFTMFCVLSEIVTDRLGFFFSSVSAVAALIPSVCGVKPLPEEPPTEPTVGIKDPSADGAEG
jgi:hypothetical protein